VPVGYIYKVVDCKKVLENFSWGSWKVDFLVCKRLWRLSSGPALQLGSLQRNLYGSYQIGL